MQNETEPQNPTVVLFVGYHPCDGYRRHALTEWFPGAFTTVNVQVTSGEETAETVMEAIHRNQHDYVALDISLDRIEMAKLVTEIENSWTEETWKPNYLLQSLYWKNPSPGDGMFAFRVFGSVVGEFSTRDPKGYGLRGSFGPGDRPYSW